MKEVEKRLSYIILGRWGNQNVHQIYGSLIKQTLFCATSLYFIYLFFVLSTVHLEKYVCILNLSLYVTCNIKILNKKLMKIFYFYYFKIKIHITNNRKGCRNSKSLFLFVYSYWYVKNRENKLSSSNISWCRQWAEKVTQIALSISTWFFSPFCSVKPRHESQLAWKLQTVSLWFLPPPKTWTMKINVIFYARPVILSCFYPK